jgi:hypothetical protein
MGKGSYNHKFKLPIECADFLKNKNKKFNELEKDDVSFILNEMCKNNNNCPFGDRCKFAHSYNELVCQTTLPCLYGPYCIIDSCQRKHFSFNDTKLLHENIYNKISKVKLNLKNDLKKQNLFNNNHHLESIPKLNINNIDSTTNTNTINRERKRFINSNHIKDIKDNSPLNTTSTTPTNISPRERDEKKYILLKQFLKKNSINKDNINISKNDNEDHDYF